MKETENYIVYPNGKIWSKKRNRYLKENPRKDGYIYSNYGNGNQSAHRFIWEKLVGEIPDGYEIDHKNSIRHDNRLENLRCVTVQENRNNRNMNNCGRKKANTGYTYFFMDKEFTTVKELAKHVGYSVPRVYELLRSKTNPEYYKIKKQGTTPAF